MALAFSLHQPVRLIADVGHYPFKLVMASQAKETVNAEMIGVLHHRINSRAIGLAHVLQQAAKGPTDRAREFVLAYTGRIAEKGHQFWEGHQTLHHCVCKTSVRQCWVVQTHRALQSGTVSMRHSQHAIFC